MHGHIMSMVKTAIVTFVPQKSFVNELEFHSYSSHCLKFSSFQPIFRLKEVEIIISNCSKIALSVCSQHQQSLFQ